MSHYTVTAGNKSDSFMGTTRVASVKHIPNRPWKRYLLSSVILTILVAVLSPVMLAWAGNIWIDQKKLDHVEQLATGSYVKLDEMPDYVWQSFVSVEDHRFMTHPGVDYYSLARAVWADLQAGAYVQGGSTITMQLARNLFLTQDKTLLRKAKEIAIAFQLEQRYSKEQLLEMYLNVIYFGHGCYGIDAASQLYFGKKGNGKGAEAISLGEAAMLASLPKSPAAYSPLKHWQEAKQRQAVVLGQMVEQGVITKEQMRQAQTEAIAKKPARTPAS